LALGSHASGCWSDEARKEGENHEKVKGFILIGQNLAPRSVQAFNP
jgi:hypothetical protein